MEGTSSAPQPRDPNLAELSRLFGGGEDPQRLYQQLEQLLRSLAVKFGRHLRGHTLQPTALISEAWIRLVGNRQPTFDDRAHFVRAAAATMRTILIDHARRRAAGKRGSKLTIGGDAIEEIVQSLSNRSQADLLDLDAAMQKLADAHPEAAQHVELRFFAGMSNDEAAEIMSCGSRTGTRLWAFACAFLRAKLEE